MMKRGSMSLPAAEVALALLAETDVGAGVDIVLEAKGYCGWRTD